MLLVPCLYTLILITPVHVCLTSNCQHLHFFAWLFLWPLKLLCLTLGAGLAFWEMKTAVFPSSATALSNDSQNMVYKYPDPQAFQWDYSEVCVIYWFLEFLPGRLSYSCLWRQLGLIRHSLLAAFPFLCQFPHPLFFFTSPNKYLHLIPGLRFCLWGNQKDKWH